MEQVGAGWSLVGVMRQKAQGLFCVCQSWIADLEKPLKLTQKHNFSSQNETMPSHVIQSHNSNKWIHYCCNGC